MQWEVFYSCRSPPAHGAFLDINIPTEHGNNLFMRRNSAPIFLSPEIRKFRGWYKRSPAGINCELPFITGFFFFLKWFKEWRAQRTGGELWGISTVGQQFKYEPVIWSKSPCYQSQYSGLYKMVLWSLLVSHHKKVVVPELLEFNPFVCSASSKTEHQGMSVESASFLKWSICTGSK